MATTVCGGMRVGEAPVAWHAARSTPLTLAARSATTAAAAAQPQRQPLWLHMHTCGAMHLLPPRQWSSAWSAGRAPACCASARMHDGVADPASGVRPSGAACAALAAPFSDGEGPRLRHRSAGGMPFGFSGDAAVGRERQRARHMLLSAGGAAAAVTRTGVSKGPHSSGHGGEQLKRELYSLNVAIAANILIFMAKIWVHMQTGGASILAEAMHSVADILNQLLLRIGVLKSLQGPTMKFPYGYLRDRFVWSLISAVGIFFLGAGASVLHGFHALGSSHAVGGSSWAFAVLAVSAVLEGYSLLVAMRSIKEGADARGMSFLEYVGSGQDPTTVAVLMEDGGAIIGLGVAGMCTALTQITGNSVWDAVGSIIIGASAHL